MLIHSGTYVKIDISVVSRILDAGCGSGRDSLYFHDKGYKVDAFDDSKAMANSITQLTGLSIKHALFEDVTFENKFIGIWIALHSCILGERR